MNNPLKMFRRLRWKLTFSYMFASVVGALVVELLFIAYLCYVIFSPGFMPGKIVADLDKKARSIGLLLETKKRPLALYLDREFDPGAGEKGSITVGMYMYGREKTNSVVADTDGKIIAAIPDKKWHAGKSIFEELREDEKQQFLDAARGVPFAPDRIIIKNKEVSCSVPIPDSKGKQIGVLFVRGQRLFNPSQFVKGMLNLVGVTVVAFGVLAGVVGVFFGYFSSRNLTRRISAMSGTVEAWSGGDFSGLIADKGIDEIGTLSMRLDSMAGSLQNLILVRQRLAASEERGRIARELHDTVKQQVFAASMHIGAVRVRSGLDGTAMGDELAGVEESLSKTQSCLTNIINELAPPQDSIKSLMDSLNELASEWNIRGCFDIEVKQADIVEPDAIITRTLFLAVSEALTNAARHSGASKVAIKLRQQPDGYLHLVVSDDGCGCGRQPDETAGHGLRIMRERIESLPGGSLFVSTSYGGGFTLDIKVFTGMKKGDNQ